MGGSPRLHETNSVMARRLISRLDLTTGVGSWPGIQASLPVQDQRQTLNRIGSCIGRIMWKSTWAALAVSGAGRWSSPV